MSRRELITAALLASSAAACARPACGQTAGAGPAAPLNETLQPYLARCNLPAFAAAVRRPLFGVAGPASDDGAAGQPDLVGIAGRLPDAAMALVRGADGRARSLAIGDSVEGWRLAALARDAALFTRGAERVRVPLPDE